MEPSEKRFKVPSPSRAIDAKAEQEVASSAPGLIFDLCRNVSASPSPRGWCAGHGIARSAPARLGRLGWAQGPRYEIISRGLPLLAASPGCSFRTAGPGRRRRRGQGRGAARRFLRVPSSSAISIARAALTSIAVLSRPAGRHGGIALMRRLSWPRALGRARPSSSALRL